MTDIRNDIAALIRRVDPDNSMSANRLGQVLGHELAPSFGDLYADDVARFVGPFNRDKTLGAGALAEAIVDRFHLDREL